MHLYVSTIGIGGPVEMELRDAAQREVQPHEVHIAHGRVERPALRIGQRTDADPLREPSVERLVILRGLTVHHGHGGSADYDDRIGLPDDGVDQMLHRRTDLLTRFQHVRDLVEDHRGLLPATRVKDLVEGILEERWILGSDTLQCGHGTVDDVYVIGDRADDALDVDRPLALAEPSEERGLPYPATSVDRYGPVPIILPYPFQAGELGTPSDETLHIGASGGGYLNELKCSKFEHLFEMSN